MSQRIKKKLVCNYEVFTSTSDWSAADKAIMTSSAVSENEVFRIRDLIMLCLIGACSL